MLLNWLTYLGIWAVAIAVIAAIGTFAMSGGVLNGTLAFAAYLFAAHFLLKLLGHKRGLLDPDI